MIFTLSAISTGSVTRTSIISQKMSYKDDDYVEGVGFISKAKVLEESGELNEAIEAYKTAKKILETVAQKDFPSIIRPQILPPNKSRYEETLRSAEAIKIAAKINAEKCQEKIEKLTEKLNVPSADKEKSIKAGIIASVFKVEGLTDDAYTPAIDRALLKLDVDNTDKEIILALALQIATINEKDFKDPEDILSLQEAGLEVSGGNECTYKGKSSAQWISDVIEELSHPVDFNRSVVEARNSLTIEDRKDLAIELPQLETKTIHPSKIIESYITESAHTDSTIQKEIKPEALEELGRNFNISNEDPSYKLLEKLINKKIISTYDEALTLFKIASERRYSEQARDLELSNFLPKEIEIIIGLCPEQNESFSSTASEFIDYLNSEKEQSYDVYLSEKYLADKNLFIQNKINTIQTGHSHADIHSAALMATKTKIKTISMINYALEKNVISKCEHELLCLIINNHSGFKEGISQITEANALNKGISRLGNKIKLSFYDLKRKISSGITANCELKVLREKKEIPISSHLKNISNFLDINPQILVNIAYEGIEIPKTDVKTTQTKVEEPNKQVSLSNQENILDIFSNRNSDEAKFFIEYFKLLQSGKLPTKNNLCRVLRIRPEQFSTNLNKTNKYLNQYGYEDLKIISENSKSQSVIYKGFLELKKATEPITLENLFKKLDSSIDREQIANSLIEKDFSDVTSIDEEFGKVLNILEENAYSFLLDKIVQDEERRTLEIELQKEIEKARLSCIEYLSANSGEWAKESPDPTSFISTLAIPTKTLETLGLTEKDLIIAWSYWNEIKENDYVDLTLLEKKVFNSSEQKAISRDELLDSLQKLNSFCATNIFISDATSQAIDKIDIEILNSYKHEIQFPASSYQVFLDRLQNKTPNISIKELQLRLDKKIKLGTIEYALIRVIKELNKGKPLPIEVIHKTLESRFPDIAIEMANIPKKISYINRLFQRHCGEELFPTLKIAQ